jgi:hypothetical protein
MKKGLKLLNRHHPNSKEMSELHEISRLINELNSASKNPRLLQHTASSDDDDSCCCSYCYFQENIGWFIQEIGEEGKGTILHIMQPYNSQSEHLMRSTVRQIKSYTNEIEQAGSRDSASGLYLGEARFESRPGPGYPDWGFSWFSSLLAGECRDNTLDYARPLPSIFFPTHYSLSSNHSTLYSLSYSQRR